MGVNGAASGNEYDGDIQAIRRNNKTDHPMLVFMELIGNDVCNGHHGFDSMTTPAEFYTNILKLLNYLDTVLPAGSHVVSVGLGNGSLLYDLLHDQLHPIGVTYTDVYDYLNCLGISPCWGWMNSNDTVRAYTTERA